MFLFPVQEKVLEDPQFDCPGSDITTVIITRDVIEGKEPPKYELVADEPAPSQAAGNVG